MAIRHTGPICAGCGTQATRDLFCPGCRAEIPKPLLKAVDVAWKAYAARPASLQARNDYDLAIAAAAGAIG